MCRKRPRRVLGRWLTLDRIQQTRWLRALVIARHPVCRLTHPHELWASYPQEGEQPMSKDKGKVVTIASSQKGKGEKPTRGADGKLTRRGDYGKITGRSTRR